jgi:rare lipoprotein A
LYRYTHRHIAKLLAGATCAALLAPAGALAAGGSGGSGLGGTGTTPTEPTTTGTTQSTSTTGTTGTTQTNPLVQPADQPVVASGDGITLQTRAAGLYRRAMQFTGTSPSGDGGKVVEIERQATGSEVWLPTAHATISTNGSFVVNWTASRAGHFSFEAVIAPIDTQASAASNTPSDGAVGTAPELSAPIAASPALTATVYATSLATIYGPGFYGNKTACGQKLTRSMIGVASRSLRCGTQVTIYYDKQALTVPVIDRGPYANGASWDLTMATAKDLGITGTVTIGTTQPLSITAPLG